MSFRVIPDEFDAERGKRIPIAGIGLGNAARVENGDVADLEACQRKAHRDAVIGKGVNLCWQRLASK